MVNPLGRGDRAMTEKSRRIRESCRVFSGFKPVATRNRAFWTLFDVLPEHFERPKTPKSYGYVKI